MRTEDDIVTCFRDGAVTLRKNRRTTGFTNALKEIGYQGVRKGDFVMHVMDAFAGAIGVSDSDGKCTPVYSVCEARPEANAQYFAYLTREMSRAGFILALAKGIRERSSDFRYETFGALRFCLPPPEEQDAIVRFLDHYDRLIRKYIRAKQKLIALLTEQKQAIIQRAVTRGLNPDVKFKSSGVVWLGDIPEEWEQHALWTLSRLRIERNPGGLQLLSVFLHRGVIRYEEGGGQVHAPSLDLSNYQVVHPGDFVLNNQQAWRGSVGVSSHHGIISPAYIVLKLSDRLHSPYANYLLQSRPMVDQFVAASKGVGDIQRQIYWPFLRTVQVPVPPMDEQKEIVDYLDASTQSLSQAIAQAEREIALMREYRTRLTADVVTGKIDVREAAAALPAAADASPIDDTELDETPDAEEALDAD